MKNDVTFGELLKRVEALEAAAKLHPRCLPVQVTDADVPYTPHPAYAVAKDWWRKYKAAEAELREKNSLLEMVTADYRMQYKRAEAADHNRNEIMKATQCRRFSESDCQCAKCYRDKELSELRETIVTAKRERDSFARTSETLAENSRQWKAKADANQAAADRLKAVENGMVVVTPAGWASLPIEEEIRLRAAADTLERLRKGYRVDGQILVTSFSTWRDLNTERDALAAKVEELQSALSSRDPACEPSIPIADHSKLLAEKANLETTIRAQDDHRLELQGKVEDLHTVIDGLRQQLAARPEYPPRRLKIWR